MLPQKFSAATTEILPPGPALGRALRGRRRTRPGIAATEHRHDGE